MNHLLKKLKLIGLLSCAVQGYGQEFNYKGIDIQGQLKNATTTEVSLNFRIIDLTEGIVWEEDHIDVPLYDQNTYQLTLGQGTYLGGSIVLFENVNWFNVDRVEIRRTDAGPAYLIGTCNLLPLPYSFHSLTTEFAPFTFDLTDNISSSPGANYVLRFDGTQFFTEEEWLGDTANFAWFSGTATYTDTATYAYSPNDADSALLAFYSDTAGYAINADSTVYADTAYYADTAGVVSYAINNWGISGNSGISSSNFVGTSNAEYFRFRTNAINRLSFGNNNIFNSTEYNGFALESNQGALFNMNTNPGITNITTPFLYFHGLKRGFSGGENAFSLDSAMGTYSFVWGKDNSANGIYATVFGLGNIADSTTIGATSYDAEAGFASGRGNRVSRMGVAIGDSCKADYYRNVAIGKNVIANNNSATTGIGWNVLSTGATTWAAGQNITATGNYSTVMGTNASSNGFTGTFVYGDNSTIDTVKSTAAHQFMVRAAGGFIFYSSSDLSMGVELTSGAGSWTIISDRNKKANIQEINSQSFQKGLSKLPISKWSYRNRNERHIGPMAQDFYTAFGLGESKRHINMVDIHGVTFMGIKHLSNRLKETDGLDEKDELQKDIEDQKEELENLKKRIKVLNQRIIMEEQTLDNK